MASNLQFFRYLFCQFKTCACELEDILPFLVIAVYWNARSRFATFIDLILQYIFLNKFFRKMCYYENISSLGYLYMLRNPFRKSQITHMQFICVRMNIYLSFMSQYR